MTLTLEQVRHVATLARLSLTADEEQRYQGQLSAILEAVAQLAALDTSNVEPTSHATLAAGLQRPDVAQQTVELEKLLQNAPARVGTSLAVPKILE